MKALIWIVPFAVGASTVLQAALNKRVMGDWGLAPAVLFNTAVFLAVSLAFLAWTHAAPQQFPDGFAPAGDWSQVRWWWILPGLFGMVIVVGSPWAIRELGAARLFVGVVAAQMIGSLLWDACFEARPLNWQRLTGSVLALAGAWLSTQGDS